jgi:hypothetical protein
MDSTNASEQIRFAALFNLGWRAAIGGCGWGGKWSMSRMLFDPEKTFQLRGPLRRLQDTQRYGLRVWLFAGVAPLATPATVCE